MPEEKKPKNDPKEQRKSRRRHEPRGERKNEQQSINKERTNINQNQQSPTVNQPQDSKVPEKPAYEPPGPEFYKSLKRETDEILKITEEENMKYKKKEIQSNWAKYEMPIESYNEIEEQENMGADYEALIQAPLSVGGHFQFKHEKSWDVDTGPSLYDKYFEIDMDQLALAVSTIPFFERNNIDKSNFNESDIFNMNNRATKFKQKYYNDKKYTTPEMEVQETILNILKKSDDNNDKESPMDLTQREDETLVKEQFLDLSKDSENNKENESENSDKLHENKESPAKDKEICRLPKEKDLESGDTKKVENRDSINLVTSVVKLQDNQVKNAKIKFDDKQIVDDIDDIIEIVGTKTTPELEVQIAPEVKVPMPTCQMPTKMPIEDSSVQKEVQKVTNLPQFAGSPVKEEPKKNPIIESPEDLEKWLDDFLDD